MKKIIKTIKINIIKKMKINQIMKSNQVKFIKNQKVIEITAILKCYQEIIRIQKIK